MPGGATCTPGQVALPTDMTQALQLAIIGGTGLSHLDGLGVATPRLIETPYQAESVLVSVIDSAAGSFAFLPRHGEDHLLPPHRVNYRANLWALHVLGVTEIIAVNAVGGIHGTLGPGNIAIPEQLIDYTWGRETSYFESDSERSMHVDFTSPYSPTTRQLLLHAVAAVNEMAEEPVEVLNHGVYACTQGPRLETAAEVQRLKRDGCDMVGMTGMPEAVLARELGMYYGCLALSVNWAAGLGVDPLTFGSMETVTQQGMGFVHKVLQLCIETRLQRIG